MAWDDSLHRDALELFEPPNLWECSSPEEHFDASIWSAMRFFVPHPYETKRKEADPCKGCGKHFPNRKRGWLRAFCSDVCRRKFHIRDQISARKALRALREKHLTCGECAAEFVSRASGGKPQRFCSEKCARRAGRKARR